MRAMIRGLAVAQFNNFGVSERPLAQDGHSMYLGV